MLSSQIEELREAAGRFEGYQNGEMSRMLREAADTIFDMRERLQDVQTAKERAYNAGFDNGMKATLQQLSGLIAQGAYVDEIKEWADSQWKEEVA